MSSHPVKKSTLPAAAGILNARHGGKVTYGRLYKAILNGDLPANQINGRYEIDLDVAAEVFGLTESAAA